MMFGSIHEGVKMLKDCEFNEHGHCLPRLLCRRRASSDIRELLRCISILYRIFNGNAVAGVFVISLLLSLFLPKENKARQQIKKIEKNFSL